MASPTTNKRRNVVSPKSAEKNALNFIAEEADSREARSQEVLTEARKLRSSERMKDKSFEDCEDDDTPIENGHATSQTTSVTDTKQSTTTSTTMSASPPQVPSPQQPTTNTTALEAGDSHDAFKRAMLLNAQLDNECRVLKYQTELLKDCLESANEASMQLKAKIRKLQHDKSKGDMDVRDLQHQLKQLQLQLHHKDNLIREHGFSMVVLDDTAPSICNGSSTDLSCSILSSAQLDLLSDYTGSLGSRIQQLHDEKSTTMEMNKKLQRELDEAKTTIISTANLSSSASSSPSLLSDNANPLEGRTNELTETRYRLKRAEQEITTLQGCVTRLETQLLRYKTSAEELERSEEELKADKRRLQIELRETKEQAEEVQTKNSHLLKRLEKMKANRIQEALQ